MTRYKKKMVRKGGEDEENKERGQKKKEKIRDIIRK